VHQVPESESGGSEVLLGMRERAVEPVKVDNLLVSTSPWPVTH